MFENIKQSKSFRKIVLEWYQECLFLILDENKVSELLSSLFSVYINYKVVFEKKKKIFPWTHGQYT